MGDWRRRLCGRGTVKGQKGKKGKKGETTLPKGKGERGKGEAEAEVRSLGDRRLLGVNAVSAQAGQPAVVSPEPYFTAMSPLAVLRRSVGPPPRTAPAARRRPGDFSTVTPSAPTSRLPDVVPMWWPSIFPRRW